MWTLATYTSGRHCLPRLRRWHFGSRTRVFCTRALIRILHGGKRPARCVDGLLGRNHDTSLRGGAVHTLSHCRRCAVRRGVFNVTGTCTCRVICRVMPDAPHPLFFPVGCVMVFGENIWPVLDPECTCDPHRCCLRAQCACFWESFIAKASDAISDNKHYTNTHKMRILRIVSEENPQVVLGQFERDVRGRVRWKDCFTFE